MASKHMKSKKNNRLFKNTKNNNQMINNISGKLQVKKVILVVSAILIILAGIFTCKTIQNGGGLKGVLATLLGQNSITKKDMQEIQFLILGESLNLTDTIMIGKYDPITQKASLVSVQRDTFIGDNPKKATAYDKINSVYQGKYPEKSLKEINELTGLNLKYYVVIDTEGLKELVDTIGGVKFNVPIDMNYDDTSQDLHIHLSQGEQLLNGDKAEQVLRFRHNNDGSTYSSEYGTQDNGRMKTQREFISAILKQTLKLENVLKIGNFIDIANKNVKTNIPISTLKDYIPYAVEFSTSNLKTATLPGEPKELNGVWLYLTDEGEAEKMISQFFFDGPIDEEINKDMPSVEILNGSGHNEQLEKVVNKFKEKGYNVLKVGNASSKTKQTTIINRTKQDNSEIEKVKTILGKGKTSAGKDTEEVDFTITIGQDY